MVLEVGIGACLDTKLLKVGDLRDQGIKHDAYIIFLLFVSNILTNFSFWFYVIFDSQVKLIKEEFGYDDAFNYKTETDLDAALNK